MKVRDLMTPAPQTIHPNDTLSLAEERMQQGRFRRLPVVDEAGNLVGILTDGNLREHVGYLASTRVTAAMSERLVTVPACAEVETAAQLMVWHKIGGLPVVEGGRMVGIITESDLLLALADAGRRGAPATESSDPPEG